MNFKTFLHIYTLGAIGYCFIEIVWRGYTHWSMGVLGGLCFVTIYLLEKHLQSLNLLIKALVSALFITSFELVTGIIVNRLLGFNVWDYSGLKFNFMGQISMVYSVFWFALCIPCILLCKILRHRVFDVLSWAKSKTE